MISNQKPLISFLHKVSVETTVSEAPLRIVIIYGAMKERGIKIPLISFSPKLF